MLPVGVCWLTAGAPWAAGVSEGWYAWVVQGLPHHGHAGASEYGKPGGGWNAAGWSPGGGIGDQFQGNVVGQVVDVTPIGLRAAVCIGVAVVLVLVRAGACGISWSVDNGVVTWSGWESVAAWSPSFCPSLKRAGAFLRRVERDRVPASGMVI